MSGFYAFLRDLWSHAYRKPLKSARPEEFSEKSMYMPPSTGKAADGGGAGRPDEAGAALGVAAVGPVAAGVELVVPAAGVGDSDIAHSPSIDLQFAECKDILKNQKDSLAAANTRAGLLMGATGVYVTAVSSQMAGKPGVIPLAVLAAAGLLFGFLAFDVKRIATNFNPSVVRYQHYFTDDREVKRLAVDWMLELIKSNGRVLAQKHRYVRYGLICFMVSITFVLTYSILDRWPG